MSAQRTPARCSRRSVLSAAGSLGSVAALSLVAGCRVRLQDDAPHLPLLPTRARMPDEDTLRRALLDAWALQDLAVAVPGDRSSVAGRLRSAHGAQASALSTVLRAGGAPLPPRPARATLLATPQRLGQGEQASLTVALAALGDVDATHAPLLVSLAAQRAVAAAQLGAVLHWPGVRAPTGTGALPLLASARAGVYGFQVVAAQTDRGPRAAAGACLSTLTLRAAALQAAAGRAAPPPPLGWTLPYPVRDARSATALARRLLSTLSQDTAAAATAAAGDRLVLQQLVAWIWQDEALAVRWGVPPAALPGLTTTARP